MTRRFPPKRRLHLVDIENLAGFAWPASEQVAACCRRYADLVNPHGSDLFVLACNHGAGVAIADGWPGARYLWHSGRDGAELALLEVLSGESVTNRFRTVVLGSGDGAFAGPAADLALNGVHITVVANCASLSRRLRLAASEVVVFDDDLSATPFPRSPGEVA